MKINRSNPLFRAFLHPSRLLVQSTLAFVVSMTSLLSAADLIWDANGDTATITNGAGTWDKTSTNWWDGSTNVAWTDGNTAVIGSSTVAGAGGVINFADSVDITVASLKVATNGNATKHTLSAPTTGSMKFTVGSGITAEDGITINQPIFWGGDQTLSRTSTGTGALVITGSMDDDLIIRNLSLSSALGNTTVGIVLRGPVFHDGTTTLNDGYFQTRHDSFGLSEITLNGTIGAAQRLQFVNAAGSGVSGTLDNPVKLAAGKEGNFHIWGGFTTTIANPITGGDATSVLRKNDTGTLLLAAANTYTGATIVDNGTLQLGDAGSILSSSGVTISGSGVLTLGGSGNVNSSSLIPSNIVFSAAGSRVNTQGTSQSSTVTIDQDLGTATTLGQLRVTNGTATLASGTDLILNFVSVGHTPESSGNIGILNVGSGSTITLPGGNSNALFAGDSSGNAGIININGGAVSAPLNNSSGAVRIGHWAGSGSELNISAGSLSVPAGRINIGWDGSGTLNMTGGTMTAFAISVDGNGAGPACTANLNGGEILIGPNGISTAGQGTLVANGGKITATASNGWSVPRTINAGGLNANFGTGTAAITITDNSVTTGSGPLNITTDGGADKQYAINTNSPGYSGAISVASGIRLNAQQANALGTGTTTIASGAAAFLTTTGTIPANFKIEGTGWNETAGLLGAMRFQGATVSGSITVEPAGARITAHNGSVGTHTGALLGNSALEINSPVASNNGTINLNGDGSAFIGPVTVSQGRLNLGGSLGGSVTVADGSTLGGEGAINGTLTLGSATGTTLAINPVTPGALTAASSVVLNGVNTVVFTTPPTALGPIPVFSHGGLTGTLGTELVIATPGNYRTATWSDVAGLVSLDLGNKNLTWTGSGSSTWDLGVSTNWADPAASAFYWADNVTFGESSVPAVALSGLLAPASVTVQSDTTNYVLTSSAGNQLTGSGALLKKGDSILTMAGANAYTGGSTLSKGQIYLRTAGTLGSGTVTLGDANTATNNIALYLDTNRVNFGTPIVVSSLATGTVTLGSRTNIVGTGDNNQFTNITLQRDVIFDANAADRTDFENVTGTGNVTVSGTGRAVFAVANTFVGTLTIDNTNPLGLQLGTNSAAFNAIPDATNVTISAGGTLSVSYTAGGNETIAGLNGAGTLRNNGGNANSLTVGSGGASGSFSGTITNGGAGAFSFIKTGAGTQALLGTASSNTGITTVNGGVLEVATLANGGTNSSIGASTNAATNLVLAGATLRHVGAASTTDRSLTVGTACAIEASGTGALSFINPAAITLSGTDTARTFTLGGTNTGANTFASIIPNNGTGATTVAKSGSGTWALTGSNTFTGPLQITGGKLNLSFIGNGASASQVGQSTKVGSNLLLNGGTLGYTGVTATTDRAFATGTSGGTIEVPDAVGLTFGSASSGFTIAGTLTKTGTGTLSLSTYSGSTATAASDFVVNEGVLAFTSGYFNGNPFPKNSLIITVNPSGTLRTTTAHALGGDNIDAGNSMGQIRILGGLVQFNGTQYLSNGLVSGEGRIVMEGGTLAGSADMRANGTSTFTILPSLNPSTISNTNGTNLQYGNVVMAVADGGAAKDLVVSSPLTSPAASTNTFTKSGAGLMEMSGANTYAGATNLNGGTILLSGTIRNSASVNVNGTGQLLDVTGSNAFTSGHAAAEDAAHSINVTGGTLRFGPLSQCRLGNVNLTSSATMTVDRGTGNAANYDVYLGALSSAAEATVTVGGTSSSTINGSGFLRLGTNTNFAVADANPTGTDLTVSIGFRNQTLDQSNAAGGFTKTGAGTMELSGVSLHTGNTTVAEGTLNLAPGGSLLFVPTTNGTSNKVTGTGSAAFAGTFSIDLAAANTTDGNSWILADVATQSFASTFTVTGFGDPDNDGIWERELDGNLWSFAEATGTLSVAPAGNTYASWIDGFFPGETNPSIIGAGADPDADGIANAVEFVIGGNPESVMDADLLPTLELVTDPPTLPAGQYLKFTYRRSAESVDAGVLSTAQHDADLAGTWSTAVDNASGVEIIETPNGAAAGIDKVEVFIPRATAATLFGRLSVEVP